MIEPTPVITITREGREFLDCKVLERVGEGAEMQITPPEGGTSLFWGYGHRRFKGIFLYPFLSEKSPVATISVVCLFFLKRPLIRQQKIYTVYLG